MDPYHLQMPENWSTGVIFASPHSGSHYPADLMQETILSPLDIRSSEDVYVDRLFSAAPRFGAPLMTANYPRAYLDLNRAADELDPAVVRGAPVQKTNPRIASGLGVIPRVVANGRSIYKGKLSLEEATRRIETIWHPYHSKISSLLGDCQSRFGSAVLIDCHSMPRDAVEAVSRGRRRPDIVLGDRFGASAGSDVTELLEAAFASAGLKVSRNAPFAGAYIAQRYGRPSRGQHVVQVEIDRSLYMDEVTLRPKESFHALRSTITHVVAEVTAFGRGRTNLAAE
jgi:N-formylglutamate deformylase